MSTSTVASSAPITRPLNFLSGAPTSIERSSLIIGPHTIDSSFFNNSLPLRNIEYLDIIDDFSTVDNSEDYVVSNNLWSFMNKSIINTILSSEETKRNIIERCIDRTELSYNIKEAGVSYPVIVRANVELKPTGLIINLLTF